MPPAIYSLIFIGVGLVLLLIEIKFVPGMGLLGVLAMGAIAYGAYLAMGHYDPLTATLIIGGAGTAATLGILFLVKSRSAQKLVLADTMDGEPSDLIAETVDLVGKTGVALTNLRPAGMARIEGRRLDVVADDGAYIESDERVRVVRVRQNSVIVTRE